MTIKAIFFDLDNTLWDFSSSAKKALDLVYQKYLSGEGIDTASWQDSYIKHNKMLWQDYRAGKEVAERVKHLRFLYSFSDMGVAIDDNQVREVSDFFLRAIVDNTVLYPGVLETLDRLQKHYILGVITNGFIASTARLDALGLNGLFSIFITAEDAGKPKPDKHIFHKAVLGAGVKPQEVVYVGDDYESDIVGAKAAGLNAVLFDPKNRDISAMEVQPEHRISEFSRLIEIYLPVQNNINRR